MAVESKPDTFLRKLLQYFLQGVAVIAPVGITLYVVVWLFRLVDNILPDLLYTFFPQNFIKTPNATLQTIPGLGFLVVIFLVILTGALSSGYIAGKFLDAIDHVLQRTPGLKFIYSSVKDILQAFTGNKKKFNRPVLVKLGENEVWRIGFITQETMTNFNLPEHDVVYIPLSYSITGITYIVPKKNIQLLLNVSSAEAMKFAVSGGLAEVD